MKILIFSQFHPPEMEPSGFMFASLAEHLGANHDVHLISGFANFPSGKFKDKSFLKVWKSKVINGYRNHNVLVLPSSNRNNMARLINYLSYMIMAFFRGLFFRKVDKIVVTSPPIFSAISALLVSKIKRIEYVLDVRDIWPDSAVQMGNIKNSIIVRIFEWVERVIYRNADSIIVATPGMVDVVRGKCDCDQAASKKIFYVPCGVTIYDDEELLQFADSNPILTEHHDKFVVLYAGLHGYAQNLRTVLDAALLLKDRGDIVFYLVGDGPDKGRLLEYARHHLISNVVFFEPFGRDQLRAMYCNVDVALVPLRDLDIFKTVFPSKTFELMSFGLPVVVGVGGEINRMISENNCGLTVEPDSAQGYAKSIIRLYENEELCSSIGANGRIFSKRRFDYTLLNKQVESIVLGEKEA